MIKALNFYKFTLGFDGGVARQMLKLYQPVVIFLNIFFLLYNDCVEAFFTL